MQPRPVLRPVATTFSAGCLACLCLAAGWAWGQETAPDDTTPVKRQVAKPVAKSQTAQPTAKTQVARPSVNTQTAKPTVKPARKVSTPVTTPIPKVAPSVAETEAAEMPKAAEAPAVVEPPAAISKPDHSAELESNVQLLLQALQQKEAALAAAQKKNEVVEQENKALLDEVSQLRAELRSAKAMGDSEKATLSYNLGCIYKAAR